MATNSDPDADQDDIDAAVLGQALLVARSADPGELIDRLGSVFAEQLGAIDLTLHLIDYRLASLRPASPSAPSTLLRPEPVDSPLGAAFRLQQATTERAPAGHLRHAPVSVRGQRLGVLTATFVHSPRPADECAHDSLALAVAYSLLEASAGTDIYEINRRHARLSVAAEMQWQLLPARAYETRHFYIAGHLEPALRVAGDAFDFVINDTVLTLAIIDATATAGGPSPLTTLAITALRNARRSGLDLAEQASVANDIIWQHSAGREHPAALLMQLDAHSGRALAVDAGSPTILRIRDRTFTELPLEPQTPLGMFEDTDYQAHTIDLHAGDRVYVITDGALTDGRTSAHLIETLHAIEHDGTQPPPESIRRLVAELTHDSQEPDDDITMVCIDWMPAS